jgi:hypothetical protein
MHLCWVCNVRNAVKNLRYSHKAVGYWSDSGWLKSIANPNYASIDHLGKNAKIAMAEMGFHKAHIIIWVTLGRRRVNIDCGAAANGFFDQ